MIWARMGWISKGPKGKRVTRKIKMILLRQRIITKMWMGKIIKYHRRKMQMGNPINWRPQMMTMASISTWISILMRPILNRISARLRRKAVARKKFRRKMRIWNLHPSKRRPLPKILKMMTNLSPQIQL